MKESNVDKLSRYKLTYDFYMNELTNLVNKELNNNPMKELIEKISGLTRYSDCSMPNTEGDRINVAQCSAYNQAIRDVVVTLNSQDKVLSKDDFKEFGFTKDVSLTFQIPALVILETTEESHKEYFKIVYSFERYFLEVYDCEGLIFVGTIKTKYECKILMRQLNIIKL